MRFRPYLAGLTFLGIVSGCGSAPALSAPSFDCNAAKAEAEKKICASKNMSRLDQEIADAYAAALARLKGDHGALANLRETQQGFVELRDKQIGFNGDAEQEMTTHRDFLAAIAPRAGWLGLWETVWGAVVITKARDGGFKIDAETMRDPTSGSGSCRSGGKFKLVGSALVSINGPREWSHKLIRQGALLELQEFEPAAGRGAHAMPEPDYCGANGRLAGRFFPIRGVRLHYGDTINVDHNK